MRKREEKIISYRPDWDVYFMSLALNAARRASCHHLKTGCVIVNLNKRVIATGYNGASSRVKSCLEQGCRKDSLEVDFDDKEKSVCRGTHAEMNALLKAGDRAEGASLYSLVYPCSACAKHIDSAGITRVFWSLDYKEDNSLTREIFGEAGISFTRINIGVYTKKLHALDIKILEQ